VRGVALALGLLGTSVLLAAEPPAAPILRLETGVHTAAVRQVAITHDGRLLTVSDDKTARLWQAADGNPQVLRVPIASGSEGALYSVAANPVRDSAVVAGWTGFTWDFAGAVYVFDLASGKITGRVFGLPGTVHALAYSRDGRYLAIGMGRGFMMGGRASLRVLDLTKRVVASEDKDYSDDVVAAAFLPNGRLATASLDGKVRLYDAGFRLLAAHTFPEKKRPWQLAVSPGGDRIAVGTLDAASVEVLSAADLKPVKRLGGKRGRRGNLSVVAWTGHVLIAAGTYEDARGKHWLRIWDLASGRAREAAVATDAITDLAVLPGDKVAFSTAEPSVGVLDIESLAISVRKRASADFREAFNGTFAVSADGYAVDFGLDRGGRTPVRFDLANHTLTRDPKPRADMARPVVPGDVQGWRNGHAPSIKGVAIAMKDKEYARSASARGATVLLGSDYALRLYQDGALAWKVRLNSPAWAVNLTRDGHLGLAALGDGTVRWYDLEHGAEVLALFVATDGRWIVWTPEGYFDHSPRGEGLVGYHINQGKAADPRFVRSGQIDRNFYRPDLVVFKLRRANLSTHTAHIEYAKDTVAKHSPPELKLLGWCVQSKCSKVAPDTGGHQRSITVDRPELTLRVEVVDRGSGVGKMVLKRKGAVVPTRAMSEAGAGGVRVEEQAITVEPGDNSITISAFDQGNVVEVGEPIRLIIHYAAAAEGAPTLHVLSVGINTYRSPELGKLKNAVSDAKGIAKLMTQAHQGLFKEVRRTVLVQKQATRANILQAGQSIAKEARVEDVVLVFLAGHGKALDGRYHFLPYDASGASDAAIKSTGLTQDELSSLLTFPTYRTAVLIDTCDAGAYALSDATERTSTERGWGNALAETGRFILAGTTTQQEALDGIGDHGVFTAVVLDGLRGKADLEGAGNKNGRVDVQELGRYAQQHVPEEAHKIAPSHAQRATIYFSAYSSDFDPFFDLSRNLQRP